MNIKGISFQIRQGETDSLQKILDGINVDKLFWYNINSQNEVWSLDKKDVFFKNEYYSGKNFYNQIKQPHHIIFLKLQAYCTEEICKNIETYNNFMTSNCVLLLLIYDCEFVEIYAKDPTMIQTFYKSALKYDFRNIAFITAENDGRTRMNIL